MSQERDLGSRERRLGRILLLGGTAEAHDLAGRLAGIGEWEVTVSLAGRTGRPAPLPGRLRVGGFGGPDGLARYLAGERITVLIDATHPFAARMPHQAAAACAATGVRRIRLLRSEWAPAAGERWTPVSDLPAATAALRALGARRVFLTTGRTDLAPFGSLDRTWFLVRSVEAPDPLPLARAEVVLARGPFDPDEEMALMRRHRIDALVTRNSGGAGSAKLAAARALRLPVVVVARPPAPPGPVVASVEEVLSWLGAQTASRAPGGRTGG